MSISITCDVCGNSMVSQDMRLIFQVNELDICSADCLMKTAYELGATVEPMDSDKEEEMDDPGPRKIVKLANNSRLVSQEPDKRYPSNDEIEQITGVIRRY